MESRGCVIVNCALVSREWPLNEGIQSLISKRPEIEFLCFHGILSSCVLFHRKVIYLQGNRTPRPSTIRLSQSHFRIEGKDTSTSKAEAE